MDIAVKFATKWFPKNCKEMKIQRNTIQNNQTCLYSYVCMYDHPIIYKRKHCFMNGKQKATFSPKNIIT